MLKNSLGKSGYVGEKITWVTPPADTAGLTDSVADWANAYITLTTGRWLIIANVAVTVVTGATAGNYTFVRTLITDTNGTVIQNCTKQFMIETAAARVVSGYANIPFSIVEDVTATKVYKIRGRQIVAGAGVSQLLNSGSNNSEFFAMRIAY